MEWGGYIQESVGPSTSAFVGPVSAFFNMTFKSDFIFHEQSLLQELKRDFVHRPQVHLQRLPETFFDMVNATK